LYNRIFDPFEDGDLLYNRICFLTRWCVYIVGQNV
jgi:hypothetical protein